MSKKKGRKSAQGSEASEEDLARVVGGVNPSAQPPPTNDTPPPIGDSNIVSPRDPASGLPTGKRMHKPV